MKTVKKIEYREFLIEITQDGEEFEYVIRRRDGTEYEASEDSGYEELNWALSDAKVRVDAFYSA